MSRWRKPGPQAQVVSPGRKPCPKPRSEQVEGKPRTEPGIESVPWAHAPQWAREHS